jgi:CRISPR/Cas system-associated endonuclease/helicase Cas3
MQPLIEITKGTLYQPTTPEIEEALQEMEKNREIEIIPIYIPKLKPVEKTEVAEEEEKAEPSKVSVDEKELEYLRKIRKRLEMEIEELLEAAILRGELGPEARHLSIEEKFNKVIHLKSFAP